MEKPTSIIAAQKLLRELEDDKNRFINEKIIKPTQEFRRKLYEEHELEQKIYDEKIKEVKVLIAQLKEKKSRKKEFHPNIEIWLQRIYSSGINWGYGGIRLSYVHPENLFVIVTSKGGTAGTGTAMGTGGYYYASASHFVAFPQFGRYRDHNKTPSGGYSNSFFETSGRLTNTLKDEMIKKAEEYVKNYDVKPFDPETLLQKKG